MSVSDGLSVSLYVPCYNAERFIAGCLEGVLAQTRPPDEILVIDDGSRDRTVELASRYPVKVLCHEENRGLGAARNSGFRNARHELVAALDADCIAAPAWLEQMLGHLADPRVAGVNGRLEEAIQSSVADRWRKVHMPQHWGDEPVRNPRFLFGNNTIYRKSAVAEAGWYDERCRTNGEDSSISVKILERGHALVYEPGALVRHQRHDTVGSILDTYWRWWEAAPTAYLSGISLGAVLRNAANVHLRGAWFGVTKQDVRAGRVELLPIDCLLPFYLFYRDLRLYWRRRRAMRPRQLPAEI